MRGSNFCDVFDWTSYIVGNAVGQAFEPKGLLKELLIFC